MQSACKQVLQSKDLAMLLQAVLDLGNVLNSGTKRGGASGFKVANLMRLVDMKSSDRSTSALKYVLCELENQQNVTLNSFLQRDMPDLKQAASDGQVTSLLSESLT